MLGTDRRTSMRSEPEVECLWGCPSSKVPSRILTWPFLSRYYDVGDGAFQMSGSRQQVCEGQIGAIFRYVLQWSIFRWASVCAGCNAGQGQLMACATAGSRAVPVGLGHLLRRRSRWHPTCQVDCGLWTPQIRSGVTRVHPQSPFVVAVCRT